MPPAAPPRSPRPGREPHAPVTCAAARVRLRPPSPPPLLCQAAAAFPGRAASHWRWVLFASLAPRAHWHPGSARPAARVASVHLPLRSRPRTSPPSRPPWCGRGGNWHGRSSASLPQLSVATPPLLLFLYLKHTRTLAHAHTPSPPPDSAHPVCQEQPRPRKPGSGRCQRGRPAWRVPCSARRLPPTQPPGREAGTAIHVALGSLLIGCPLSPVLLRWPHPAPTFPKGRFWRSAHRQPGGRGLASCSRCGGPRGRRGRWGRRLGGTTGCGRPPAEGAVGVAGWPLGAAPSSPHSRATGLSGHHGARQSPQEGEPLAGSAWRPGRSGSKSATSPEPPPPHPEPRAACPVGTPPGGLVCPRHCFASRGVFPRGLLKDLTTLVRFTLQMDKEGPPQHAHAPACPGQPLPGSSDPGDAGVRASRAPLPGSLLSQGQAALLPEPPGLGSEASGAEGHGTCLRFLLRWLSPALSSQTHQAPLC